MTRIAGFIVSHNKRVLAATVLVTLLAAAVLFRISFNADIAEFMAEGSESGAEYAALQEKYGTGDPVNVLLSLPEDGSLEDGSFQDRAGRAGLRDFRDALAGVEGADSVTSVLSAPQSARGLFLSENGRHTLLQVVTTGSEVELARNLNEFAEGDPPGGFDITLTGNPMIFARVLGMLTWFLLVIPPLVVVMLLGVFYANIGDRRLTILAVLPAFLGSVWTFGLISGLGIRIDIVTVIVPIFVIVMGSADGLHFVTHFQEEVVRTEDPTERVATTLRQVGIPMILTSISTAAGFLSLLATGVRPMQQLGVFTAAGILFAGVISFFSLPAMLSRLEISSQARRALMGPRLTRVIKALAPRRWVAGVLALGIVVFALVFIPRLAVDTDQLFFFKDDDPIREDFSRVEELFGGATPLVGEFVLDPGAGFAQLQEISAVSREMEELPGVRRVFSPADVAAGAAPEEVRGLFSGSSAGAETSSLLSSMVSSDGMRFVLLPGDFSTEDLRSWLDFAAGQEEIRTLTGMPVLWDEMARLVLQAQLRSLGAAFFLVLVMLFVAYRRVRQTVVSLIPLSLTILMLLGFLATSGIQLNLITAIASSIVLGVGIDYAIHLVAAIDWAREEGEGYVLRAIDKAGRPIVANALGIAVGLTALWLSPFKFHGHISMIMWVSMITAALTALLVIPALTERAGLSGGRGGEP